MRLMRYMRWGYTQLMECPEDYLPTIIEESRREAEAAKGRG